MELPHEQLVLLVQHTLSSWFHLLARDVKASRLERLVLCVELLDFIQADLHSDKALNGGLSGVILAFLTQHSHEVCELTCQSDENFVQSLIEKLPFHGAHEVVHR